MQNYTTEELDSLMDYLSSKGRTLDNDRLKRLTADPIAFQKEVKRSFSNKVYRLLYEDQSNVPILLNGPLWLHTIASWLLAQGKVEIP